MTETDEAGSGALQEEDEKRALSEPIIRPFAGESQGGGQGGGPDGKLGSQQGRFFYGWWIVAGGFLLMATCYTIFVNCIPLFQSHIVEDLGISMGAFNTGVSLCTVVAIFASLLFGALIDKVSSRILGGISVATTSIVLVLFSFITEIWQLYVLCVVAGIVVVAGTRLLASVITANWFTLKRGLAVSIALSGSGFGGVILSPITSTIIENWGWRPAFLVLAVIAALAALPIILVAFRNRPADKGLEPYGAHASEEGKKDKSTDTPVQVSIGWKVLLRNSGFWLLILGFIAMGIINGAVITNSVTNMTSINLDGQEIITGGHDTIWAGYVWSLYLGVVIVAKISLGAIYDRFGLRAGTLLGTVACSIAAVALCFPATDFGPIVAAVAFGFGTCMGTVSPPVMVVKEYGKKDLGLVTGIVTAFELFGAAIGAVVSGLLFDVFLSFLPAWIMVLGASVAMGAALFASIPLATRLVKKRLAAGAPMLDAEGFEIVE
ncbi:MAG: MFS transporter [Coriobacteriales bacterium]|jgi:sugar phosphate permease|nr:MFS transporter [Coriobacteriales bacterium]